MFGSELLDIAIGMIFIYLLLSLICSAVNELIEAWLKMRATDLEHGIRKLLDDEKGIGLAKRLYEHPLVYGLFKGNYDPNKLKNGRYPGRSTLPSYIPARNFALALMDIILPGAPSDAVTPGISAHAAVLSGAADATAYAPVHTAGEVSLPANPINSLRDAITKIQNPKVEQALRVLIDAAGDDVSKARENIEAWYNSSMDRVAGWYKRRVQVMIFFLGLGIAIAVNVDTINISSSLSRDKALRDSLVAASQEYAKKQSSADDPQQRIDKNLDRIRELSVPIGWNTTNPLSLPKTTSGWVAKIMGWLITAVAISLGAPFWFDLLNKFIIVRSTVKPHEKSPEEEPVG
jgi:hypothetical protein